MKNVGSRGFLRMLPSDGNQRHGHRSNNEAINARGDQGLDCPDLQVSHTTEFQGHSRLRIQILGSAIIALLEELITFLFQFEGHDGLCTVAVVAMGLMGLDSIGRPPLFSCDSFPFFQSPRAT